MRLTDEQIKDAILHEELIVRSVALEHFSESYSQDLSVLPRAAQAVENYGWDKVVQYSFKAFSNLAVTAESASWILDHLKRKEPRQVEQWNSFQRALLACLLQADVEIVRPLRDELVRLEILDLSARQTLNRRLEWSSRSPQECWQELEDIAKKCASPARKGFPHAEVRWAKAVISVLAPRGDEFADRVLELLALKLGAEGTDPRLWLQGMMIILAGRMRLAAAAPLLIDRLHDDWDWYSEQCQTSLKQIGGDAALDAISERYATAPWYVRLFTAAPLATIHTEGTTQRLTRLADLERDFAEKGEDSSLLLSELGSAFAHQFESPALQLARELIKAYEFDPEVRVARRDVVAACLMLGESIPEFDEWKQDVDLQIKRQRALFQQGPHFPELAGRSLNTPSIFDSAEDAGAPPPSETLDQLQTAVQPIARTGARLGRNDPCPCGSGKKYKKCCLRKDSGTGE